MNLWSLKEGLLELGRARAVVEGAVDGSRVVEPGEP